MEKFAQIEYVRPDLEQAVETVKRYAAVMKAAKTYDEFYDAYMAYIKLDMDIDTARNIAHIRNTINMLDDYYEKEMAYFNVQLPRYQIT